MTAILPRADRVYQNHSIDSTRWHHYVPRDDDIIISTSIKSGTTLMQFIVMFLIHGTETGHPVREVSPWPESRITPLAELLQRMEAGKDRRFLKSHLALDGLPYFPHVRYIVVGRDARDVFMSLWNHHTNYTDAFVQTLNLAPGRVGPPLPPPQQEFHAFWRDWITKGWFDWESEGYPYWGNLHHTRTWWEYRYLENIHFVHFNDLLSNLNEEIERVAAFLDTDMSREQVAQVANAVSFSTLKKRARQILPGEDSVFRGGADSFIFKGTNGRWRELLQPDELALYGEAIERVLPADCAAWLENGRAALTGA